MSSTSSVSGLATSAQSISDFFEVKSKKQRVQPPETLSKTMRCTGNWRSLAQAPPKTTSTRLTSGCLMASPSLVATSGLDSAPATSGYWQQTTLFPPLSSAERFLTQSLTNCSQSMDMSQYSGAQTTSSAIDPATNFFNHLMASGGLQPTTTTTTTSMATHNLNALESRDANTMKGNGYPSPQNLYDYARFALLLGSLGSQQAHCIGGGSSSIQHEHRQQHHHQQHNTRRVGSETSPQPPQPQL